MTILTIIGSAMIAAGLFFAVKHIAGDTAGGSALKAKVTGPAWLVLIFFGTAVVVVDKWFESGSPSVKSAEDKETISSTPLTVPVEEEVQELFPAGFTFGDNNDLDKLWRECERGVWLSCDDLYFQGDVGSDYELFGATCGGLIVDPILFCDPSNN